MKKLLLLLLITLMLLLAARGWWNLQLAPVSTSKETKDMVITKGASVNEIAKQLKKENLIRSSLAFQLYVHQQGLTSKLQAGLFKLSPAMSLSEIAKILSGGPEGIWVRILEGWRVEEMTRELNRYLNIEEAEFLKLAQEGYMFPDTYLFPREATVSYVVDTLRKTFDQRFADDLKTKLTKQGLTEEEAVILASIVEREARSDRARTEVASILLKRLKIGMGLNADATLQYALGYQPQEKSWWKRHLSEEDKKIDSPYNTYIYNGLPPTPICNPGLSSLKAVANADASTPYLYYYHDSKGNAHYAETLEEHNQNIANNP